MKPLIEPDMRSKIFSISLSVLLAFGIGIFMYILSTVLAGLISPDQNEPILDGYLSTGPVILLGLLMACSIPYLIRVHLSSFSILLGFMAGLSVLSYTGTKDMDAPFWRFASNYVMFIVTIYVYHRVVNNHQSIIQKIFSATKPSKSVLVSSSLESVEGKPRENINLPGGIKAVRILKAVILGLTLGCIIPWSVSKFLMIFSNDGANIFERTAMIVVSIILAVIFAGSIPRVINLNRPLYGIILGSIVGLFCLFVVAFAPGEHSSLGSTMGFLCFPLTVVVCYYAAKKRFSMKAGSLPRTTD